ncbi:EsaB/YukD family protein [Gephyromycinifex aptenodytis]|uniref:EsaB/YukD family protein n=1 Tax=Gephyromycinifex aptenodytis TaxID=2716227 RepID=UPI001446C76B|nr:EsaB/YukD family protein [Gephyromycinifex aptenodytis]
MTIQESVIRVRVHGPSGQLDVAVPQDLPVADLVVLLVQEMAEPGERRWLLEHPVRGPLRRESTLGQALIPEGASLLLRSYEPAEQDPFVHDIAHAVSSAAISAGTPADGGGSGTAIVRCAALSLPLFTAVLSLSILSRQDRMFGLLLAGVSAALSICLMRGRGKMEQVLSLLVFLAVVAASSVLLATQVCERPLAAAWLVSLGVFVAALVAVVLFNGRSLLLRAVGLAAGLVCALTGAALVGQNEGLSTPATAAALTVAALVLHDRAPRLALCTSGLSRLDDQHSAGTTVTRTQVSRAVHRARLDLAVCALVCSAAVACGAVLAAGQGRWGVAFALCATSVVLLRSRAFVHPEHVAVCLLPGAGGMLACVARTPGVAENALGYLVVLAALAVLLPTMITGRPTDQVSLSRLRVWAGVLEKTCTLALVPLVVPVTGLAQVISHLVH